MTQTNLRPPAAAVAAETSPAFTVLVGLTSLAILLQGVWAGMFIREGRDNSSSWVLVHDWGARTAFVLAAVATLVAFRKLRHRRDLVIGSGVLAVLLFVESYVGGEIGNTPGLQSIHFPLAIALMGLAVWLPLRTRTT